MVHVPGLPQVRGGVFQPLALPKTPPVAHTLQDLVERYTAGLDLSTIAVFRTVQMKGFEVLTQLVVKLHPHYITYHGMAVLREMKSDHPIAALNCGITFAFPSSTGDYAIMENNTMEQLSMIGNALTVQDKVGQRTPESIGPTPTSNTTSTTSIPTEGCGLPPLPMYYKNKKKKKRKAK